MKERHVEKISCCEDCGGEETIPHVLFECNWAHMFWKEVKKLTSVKVPELRSDSWPVDLVAGKMAPEREVAIILCGSWAVWTERNNRRHGEGSR